MFRHEISALKEKIIVRHRGAAVRVTITLADVGPRAPFTVHVDADREIITIPAMLDGWGGWAHGDGGELGEAFWRVAYYDPLPRSFPSFFLDAPREWDVSWVELVSHPVIVAARARADEAAREKARAEHEAWKAGAPVRAEGGD